MRKEPKVLSSEIVYKGWLTVIVQYLKLENLETPYSYDIVHVSEHGVAILPFLDEHTLLLAKQYRPPIQYTLLELIQGGVKKGEDVLDAARRELLEETGYVADFEPMLAFHPLPTCIDILLHIYKATNLHKIQEPDLPPIESLELVERPYEQVLREVFAGKHKDSALVAAMLYNEHSCKPF